MGLDIIVEDRDQDHVLRMTEKKDTEVLAKAVKNNVGIRRKKTENKDLEIKMRKRKRNIKNTEVHLLIQDHEKWNDKFNLESLNKSSWMEWKIKLKKDLIMQS